MPAGGDKSISLLFKRLARLAFMEGGKEGTLKKLIEGNTLGTSAPSAKRKQLYDRSWTAATISRRKMWS